MAKTDRATKLRRCKWFFSNSGIMTLAIEHFLAMVPATILVPIMVNNSIGITVIDMSLVLLTSGLGTILFSLLSSKKTVVATPTGNQTVIKRIPAYLGSSFAYIGLSIYLMENQTKVGITPSNAYAYVGCAYMFSGIVLAILSLIYKFPNIEKTFAKFFPACVIGPAISLIGLELSDTAIVDSGVDLKTGAMDFKAISVALITLVVIILFSLIKRRFFKNAAIIIGIVVGSIAYMIIYQITPVLPAVDIKTCFDIPNFNIPIINFIKNWNTLPSNWYVIFVAVIPATLVVFTENIGRVTVINRMQQGDENDGNIFNAEIMERSVRSHGISSFFMSLIGSVPNTLYAENIAVMGIHKTDDDHEEPDEEVKKMMNPFSEYPYWIAAIIAIIFSFIAPLTNLLLSIPKPVIGGMELFLFGIISAPGIQLLVEQRVNYKKMSNQVITAAVLITGISELSFKVGWFELKGMSLGLAVGFSLNILVIILKELGILCDAITMDELAVACLSALPKDRKDIVISIEKSSQNVDAISVEALLTSLSGHQASVKNMAGNDIESEFLNAGVTSAAEINIKTDCTVVKLIKSTNSLFVDIKKDMLKETTVKMSLNDYREAIHIEDYDDKFDNETKEIAFLRLDLSRNIPMRKVVNLIKGINWEPQK